MTDQSADTDRGLWSDWDEIERLKRLLEMAREEIAWLREQLPGVPVADHSDGSDG